MPFSERQLRFMATCRLLFRKFANDRCTTYAAALAFSSMLSIVPFLAILFAILKTLDVQTTLTPIILSNISLGSHEIVYRIVRYIQNTRVGSLGVIGLAALLFSIMSTLNNVEEAFNQIWGLKRDKAYHIKARDYLIVLLGIPMLISLAVTITSSLQNQWVLQWFFRLPWFGPLLLLLFRLVPYLSLWVALFCLYLFIPNTRVKLKSAFCGALVAGTVWQIAQWAYIYFQIGVSRSNAIYGTLALLPVFMVWVYTSWIVVLAGMELVCHLQGGVLPQKVRDGKPGGNQAVQTVDSQAL